MARKCKEVGIASVSPCVVGAQMNFKDHGPRAFDPGKVFLSVEEIKGNIRAYQMFDVRYNVFNKDYGINEYNKGHAERATFVDVNEHLSGAINSSARHPMPEPSVFVEWCKSVGINPTRPVLCYDDECGVMGACRMWWMLHALGVEVYVLSGGFQEYEAAGLPIETGASNEKHNPTTYWPYGTEFKRLLNIEDVLPNAYLVDTRSADRFNTTVRPYGPDETPGHIEGAVNIPTSVNVLSGKDYKRLRPFDECRSNLLKGLNGKWGKGDPDISNCVFYCGSGVTATFSIALACHLKLGEPYLFCGSWSEYAGRYNFALNRRAIEEHGMIFKMLSPNLAENTKATAHNAVLIADGEVVKNPDPELLSALEHMHIGEKAQVFFKSKRVAVMEVYSRKDY
ncbi:Rhodanese like domain [Trypanosoma vivax]|uniref:Putative mercaptopyruvate sulfurtransferase n=1 Tax=Trypanosoma vivax (strain Y486) TaxID=1055687 RepID=G0TZ82_TRYVY|nr:putative mercaptopyruvate sulfurtransferase [Trypanosoma vivax]KAH8613010.1 Rhodanese like domain [Trypanosoma vivax]CCC49285.1 putative mercaptopyruvate sulfurtransferase [Trypanosoma vivax Y486]